MTRAPDPSDKALDAAADGNFTSGVTHRGGYGGLTYNGRTYTKAEWAERMARNGCALAAGEGAMLCEEIDRLREEVRAKVVDAFEEVARAASAEAECEALRKDAERLDWLESRHIYSVSNLGGVSCVRLYASFGNEVSVIVSLIRPTLREALAAAMAVQPATGETDAPDDAPEDELTDKEAEGLLLQIGKAISGTEGEHE